MFLTLNRDKAQTFPIRSMAGLRELQARADRAFCNTFGHEPAWDQSAHAFDVGDRENAMIVFPDYATKNHRYVQSL